MTAVGGRSPVAEALKLTPKGRQQYDPYWLEEGRIQEILDECSSPQPIVAPLGLDLSKLTISSPPSNQPKERRTSPANQIREPRSSNKTRTQGFSPANQIRSQQTTPIDKRRNNQQLNSTNQRRSNLDEESRSANQQQISRKIVLSSPNNRTYEPKSSSSAPTVHGSKSRLSVEISIKDDYEEVRTSTFNSKQKSRRSFGITEEDEADDSDGLPSVGTSPTSPRSPARSPSRSPVRSPVRSPRSTVRHRAVSPSLGKHDLDLKRYEAAFQKRMQESIDAKLDAKERDWLLIQKRAEEQALELQLRHEFAMKKQHEAIRAMDIQTKVELQKQLERQKEEQHRYRKVLDAKYRAAEAKKQDLIRQEKEREKQRLEELSRQLDDLEQYPASLGTMLAEAEKSVSEFKYKSLLPDMALRSLELLGMIKQQADTMIEQARAQSTVDDVHVKLQELMDNAKNAKAFIATAFEYAEKTGAAEEAETAKQKEADEKAKEAQEKANKESEAAALQEVGEGEMLCVDINAYKWYQQLQGLYDEVQEKMKPLTESADKNMKKYKNNLQKAVSTPVNAISSRSGDDLRDKLRRLQTILKGDQVEVGGSRVSIREHQSAMPFVKNMLALKLAGQGDEPISSKHEAAYPIAAIVVGIWCTVPEIGDLILAHLHRVCPYTVPYYIPKAEGQSTEDHNKSLGYKYRDGKVEEQDKFLKRMSGYVRLYAAIMITDPPPGCSAPHPHGLSHAWVWLARLINIQPHPDITATLLYDMLQVTGHYLDRAYTKQFHKLLNIILTVFLPKIREVTPDERMGPVTRLEICLENWLKERRIPPPEGVVTSQFWFTKDDSDAIYGYY